VIVWLLLEPREEDWSPAEDADAEVGTRPKWLDEELRMDGWDSVLTPGWRTYESGEGWNFADRWATWGLSRGLVPDQPFALRVEEPRWYRCSYEYDEWDVEWTWEFLWAQPVPKESAAWRVRSWQLANESYRARACAAMRALKEKRRTDVGAMYLRYGRYGSTAWGMPAKGFRVHLCSSHTQVEGLSKWARPDLVEGRSDKGDREEAMAQMIQRAAERKLPLDADAIRALPKKW
jgi:hypothetical protein